MIRLTYKNSDRVLYVAAEKIAAILPDHNGGSTVYVEHPTGNYFSVEEEALDVARLRAAWELRFASSALAGKLPIGVYMTQNPPTIQFMCCTHTERLRAEREASEVFDRDDPDAAAIVAAELEASAIEDFGR